MLITDNACHFAGDGKVSDCPVYVQYVIRFMCTKYMYM